MFLTKWQTGHANAGPFKKQGINENVKSFKKV